LEAYGVTYNDIQPQYLSFAEAANALNDGKIDAAFLTAGSQTSAVQDIASQHKVRLLPVDADKADALIAKYPFYTKTVIPAGTYAGFEEDVPAVSVMAMLVANEKVTEQQGYDIAKSIFSNLDRLQAAHAVGKLITKETATAGMPLKMNAGAEKFFKEK
jgi:TRAP transporter TAXI family solute receptor